ncbi:hypothetical protein [Paenibacillus sp. KR2-11]
MSVREDIGALFAKNHASKAALGVKMLRLSKEKSLADSAASSL